MKRPQFLPSVLSLCVLAVLIGLGNWQMARLDWKQKLIAKIDTRLSAPAISLASLTAWADLLEQDYDYQNVILVGRFDHAQEVYWYAGAHQFETGVHVITPFILQDGSIVLVNRGFVPERLHKPSTRVKGQIEGIVSVSGLMRWPSERTRFEMADNFDKRLWFVKDLPSMAAYLNIDVAPFFVELDAKSSALGGPKGAQTLVHFSNRHLEYAMTWYGLGLTLVIIFSLWQLMPTCVTNGRLR